MNTTELNNFVIKVFKEIGLVLSKPLTGMLSILIICLLKNNKAHLSALARALPMDEANEMAHMQRVRRFLSNTNISPAIVLLPLIRLLRPILSKLPEIVLIPKEKTELSSLPWIAQNGKNAAKKSIYYRLQ